MPSAPLGVIASHDHFKEATGGTKTTASGYTIHTFTSSGTFTIGAKGMREIEWEIIGGGGAGGQASVAKYGSSAGGGGGAGGYITGQALLSPYKEPTGNVVTAISVTVGAGGNGTNGNPSKINRDGNTANSPEIVGQKAGANGGGTFFGSPTGLGTSGWSGSGGGGAAGYSPNGNNGGASNGGYGGGGGAGGAGGDGSTDAGGNGGAGIAGVCGGGGGSSLYSSVGGTASDGGGSGGSSSSPSGGSGTANTGGGGGGSSPSGLSTDQSRPGGLGGSGKVIIKYKTV